MAQFKERLGGSALVTIQVVVVSAAVLSFLWVAKDICIPIALAGLLTFLLAPLITRMERWLGRISSVLIILMMVSMSTGVVGYVVSKQLLDLTEKLPEYYGNIQKKVTAFQEASSSKYHRLSLAIEALRKDLPVAMPAAGTANQGYGSASQPIPVTVKMIDPDADLSTRAQSLIRPILETFAMAGLVILLTVFMLLHREDLRGRLIRFVGQGHISVATTAMADAGARVFRYLVLQLLMNISFGLLVTIGLYAIGLPNAPLWGALAAALRFIPYVGPILSACLPLALACAASDGWTMPLLTLSLFLGLELVTNNIVEPWLYGVGTGVSSLAIILAAVFWGWLWGPIGLILATPLTVCLVVMGRHIPQLRFLSVLLSDEDALAPHEECYHRLLRSDLTEATALVDRYLKSHPVTALYDDILIPVLIAAEAGHGLDELDRERLATLHHGIRDLIDDVSARKSTGPSAPHRAVEDPTESAATAPPKIICLPVRAVRDELAATMLMQVLNAQGCQAEAYLAKETAMDLVEAVAKRLPDVVCISVVSPSAMVHARNLCTKLCARLPDLRIIIGFWNSPDRLAELRQAFADSPNVDVVTSLSAACRLCPGPVIANEPLSENNLRERTPVLQASLTDRLG